MENLAYQWFGENIKGNKEGAKEIYEKLNFTSDYSIVYAMYYCLIDTIYKKFPNP